MKKKTDQASSVGPHPIGTASSANYIGVGDGEGPSDAQGGLLVSQDGGGSESRAFDFYRGAGYIVSVTITIKRPQFAIAGFDLLLPWQSYVWWLADPRDRVARPPVYRFDRNCILEYNRDQVLNHLADVRRWRGVAGRIIPGILPVGIGNDPIPEQFKQGAIIPAFLIVLPIGMGRTAPFSPVSLWTDRTRRFFKRERSGQPRQGGLLDKRDSIGAGRER